MSSPSPINFLTLVRRSFKFYAGAHLGALAACAIGGAALVGSLVVGDSVRGSLQDMALSRLGPFHFAMYVQDRFFPVDLAERIDAIKTSQDSGPFCHPGLMLPGTASKADASSRVNHVNVIGVRTGQWANMAGWRTKRTNSTSDGEAYLNERLAKQLSAQPGDELVVRVRKPSLLGFDAVVSPRDQATVALRVTVAGILSCAELGDFSLTGAQAPPANLFLDAKALGKAVGMEGRANFLAFKGARQHDSKQYKGNLPEIDDLLRRAWQIEDGGLEVRLVTAETNSESTTVEVATPRVFLDAPVVEALTGKGKTATGSPFTNSTSVLTYLANLIEAGDRSTPYSMVTAIEDGLLPVPMRDNEIVINQWLAEDLNVRPGSTIQLSYYVPDSGTGLREQTNIFQVRAVVPLAGRYADRTLMPEFPGLATAESTSDWDAGFPLVYKIREKDEDYWRRFRGTPKAFVTFSAGQVMWSNRFGSSTAIRIPVPRGIDPEMFRQEIRTRLSSQLRPVDFGMVAEPVRARALKAAAEAQDFGQLFLGFSIFLAAAALLLMVLVYQFNLEQRGTETGTLLALGFQPSVVRRMRLMEGLGIILSGAACGVAGGVAFAKAMMWGLSTIWRDAVGTSALEFHAKPQTLLVGAAATVLVGIGTIWLALRKQARQPARELLVDQWAGERLPRPALSFQMATAFAVAACGLLIWSMASRDLAPGVFFCAGSLLLLAGLGLIAGLLARMGSRNHPSRLTFARLGIRGAARRGKRSLAVVGLLACGSFLIVAISAFRIDAGRDAFLHSSGTGGFALLGESASPIAQDPQSTQGKEAFGLDAPGMPKVGIIPFRVRDGDEASCLNLARAQKPRLLAVHPDRLRGRFTFASVVHGRSRDEGWDLLEQTIEASHGRNTDHAIPAIGDANSIKWALGRKLGDTLEYTDENGRTFKVRLVAALANSVLQGSLIIDEKEFVQKFPNAAGYRFFLVDTASNAVPRVTAAMSRALEDYGLELTPAVRRLNEFNAVQNTYLGTFQVLGGIGLLIGSAGLAIVVLRNVLERRGELGLFVATGFRERRVRRLLLYEHAALLGCGITLGTCAAAVSVLPVMLVPGTRPPLGVLAVMLAAVLINGLGWTYAATVRALRGNLLDALRGE